LIERNPLDLRLKPPSMAITQKPPRGFQSHIVWVQASTDLVFSASSGGASNAESFALSDVAALSTMSQNWDQYCIYAVKIRLEPIIGNSGVVPGALMSVIDFDNASIPTGPGQMEEYGNFMVTNIVQGVSHERLVLPCVTPLLYAPSSLTAFATARTWIDSAQPAVPHYGIKYGVYKNSSTIMVANYKTYVVGFRNNI